MVGTEYSPPSARIYSLVVKQQSHRFKIPIVRRDLRQCFVHVVVSEFIKAEPADIG